MSNNYQVSSILILLDQNWIEIKQWQKYAMMNTVMNYLDYQLTQKTVENEMKLNSHFMSLSGIATSIIELADHFADTG